MCQGSMYANCLLIRLCTLSKFWYRCSLKFTCWILVRCVGARRGGVEAIKGAGKFAKGRGSRLWQF